MFEEIRQRVNEGRWELCEGWWNQPDCFSASGESYVRQGLYGQRYLMQNFGKMSECAFNTDSFGHSAMLPQIFAKSGIKYCCICRPEERHYPLHSPLFRWRSSDGSSVMAFRIGGAAGESWPKDTAHAMNEVNAAECDVLMVYGVTDHGGAPTKKSIEEIMEHDGACFSTVKGFFEKQVTDYEVTDEFLTGDFGVYCNNAEIKKLNRIAEYALQNAEKSCVIAKEKANELTDCWHDVLFNQFHDILGGASIKNAYFDAKNLYGRAIQSANEIMHFNLQKVTAMMKMPGKNPDTIWNLVIWNLNGCEYDGYAAAEVQWAHEFDWYDKGITLEDEYGNRIKTQIIAEHSAIPRFRSRFMFKVKLPSVGCRSFKVIQNGESQPRKTLESVYGAESERYIYKISEINGSITSVTDKTDGRIVAKNLFVPVCYEDDGDTWCFNVSGYGEKKGTFSVIKSELTETGELADKIKLTLKYDNSMLYMYYTFYKTEGMFDLDYTVVWNETHTVFKFECETEGEEITVSSPYAAVTRGKSKLDRPMGEWLTADKLTYLSTGNFAYNFYDGIFGITVLRSPIYGDFRLGELPVRDYDIMEQGKTEGSIRVIPDCGEPVSAAMQFNNRPIIICESNHEGTLPGNCCFADFNADNAYLTAMKYAEDDNSVIVRLVDYSAKKQDTVLSLSGTEYKVRLGANEIKTLKINNGAAAEVDMTEGELL